MKYFVRSVKYFFYFSAVTAFIVFVLVMIGAVGTSIDEIFDGGYSALWKIAVFFAIVAAVYPKVGFITRDIPVGLERNQLKGEIAEFFRERHYVLENETGDTLTFRYRSVAGRILKMCEDRITVTCTGGAVRTEGLRKDVMRLSAGLEHRFSPETE